MSKFKLTRTKQCANCPWKVDADLSTIPGYVTEHHERLENTIADGYSGILGNDSHVMACHHSTEGNDEYCIGWLVNQLGPGNNIGMRFKMIHCENAADIEVFGQQYQAFEDTLPENR